MSVEQPTSESSRIESLDVFRGFALLGILLLNIIGFGLLSPSYSNPAFDLSQAGNSSIITWATIELFAEGAMRCLFSILFGAGVVLFTTGVGARSGWTHYRRTFWLLMFGLFDAFILLWTGDILVTYALAGALLYLAREQSVRALITAASIMVLLMSLLHLAMGFGLNLSHDAYQKVIAAEADGSLLQVSQEQRELALGWEDFVSDFELGPEQVDAEFKARTESYSSAFQWTLKKNIEAYQFVLPVFLFWDALAMMLLGMALYKSGVLHAEKSKNFYLKLALIGFATGLLINGFEVHRAYSSDFSILTTFAQMQPTYHLGRLGMALGYIGLLGLVCKLGLLSSLTSRLAAVGRMALTNYLMHSFICAILFTGLGFGFLGAFTRFELYGIVIAIWLFQLGLSPIWLKYFRFGPIEWLWRALTYGTLPAMRR
jgi:uncharacterized protein